MNRYGKVINDRVNRDFLNTLIGFGTGAFISAFLVIVLMFSSKVEAYDANGEAFCLAKNIYFEAGNQPMIGKVAVSHVVLNRVDSSLYPDTICDVVYQAQWRVNWKGEEVPVRHRCQFSWFCDGKSDVPLDSATWLSSMHIARDVIQLKYGDITEGSTHYHADFVYPYWADSLNETVVINNHIFYK